MKTLKDRTIRAICDFFDIILELVFQEKNICFICDQYDEKIKDSYICNDCFKKLMFIEGNKCKKCCRILDVGYSLDLCHDCINHKFYFDKAISALEYTGIVKDAIYKFKYRNKGYMYKMFGYILVQALKKEDIKNIDLIVGVPLHKKKKIKRGFNQAYLLGKHIGKKLDVKVDNKSLVRNKNTSTQNKLNKTSRLQNVKNAFKVKNIEVFKDKKVLLIDDIFTTGSTVNECSKVLMKTGVKEVVVLTIATGRNY